MKNRNAPKNRATRRSLSIAFAAALAAAYTFALPHSADAADKIPPIKFPPPIPPIVPTNIQVPAGNTAYLEGHAVGTQNYMCLPSPAGYSWILFAPQATLFNDYDRQVITHFLSQNPLELGTLRAAWQHSEDTSTVWALTIATSTDPAFVEPGAIPWLLLKVAGAQKGPTGGDALTATTYIQRLTTSGGVAPAAGCSQLSDVGKRAFVPYSADYFFYH